MSLAIDTIPQKTKGRAARRASVVRKSLLLDLALPHHKQGHRRLTDRQTKAAFCLHRDLEARWASSLGTTMAYGEVRGGDGNGPIRKAPSNFAAMDRISHLKTNLHPHQRDLLGEIERLSFDAKTSIASLPIATGFSDEKLDFAVKLGEVRGLLNSVADLYGC